LCFMLFTEVFCGEPIYDFCTLCACLKAEELLGLTSKKRLQQTMAWKQVGSTCELPRSLMQRRSHTLKTEQKQRPAVPSHVIRRSNELPGS